VHWVARAATLTERLPYLASAPAEPSGLGAQISSQWCAAVAGGAPDRWARRLARLGLVPDDIDRLVATDAGGGSWAVIAAEAAAEARRLASTLDLGDDVAWKRDVDLAFATMWEPWVAVARRRACTQRAADAELLDDLAELLRLRLAGLGERAVHEAFRVAVPAGEARVEPYRGWVRDQLAGGFGLLLEEYPVLGRVLAIACEHWVDAAVELCERLAADRDALSAAFGFDEDDRIVAIDALGDAHEAGRQVLRLVTVSGASVIYKPRSIEPECTFAAAATALRRNGGVDVDLTPAMVAREGYGWAEFVEAKACADDEALAAHSRRAGAALALAHVLAVTDLHLENVIGAGDQPVLIDLECIASAPLRTTSTAELPRPLTAAQTVLSTCLLPMSYNDRPLAVDISGLTATKEQVSGDLVPVWSHLGTSAIRVDRRPLSLWSTVERPPSAQRPPIDVDALLGGLTAAFDVIRTHGLGLPDAPRRAHRVVVRDTQSYAELLAAAASPENLRDGLRFSIALDANARHALADDAAPWQWAMAECERRSLEALDVPLAVGSWDSVDLQVGDTTVPGVLLCRGDEIVQTLLETLDDAQASFQAGVAQIALEAHLGVPPVHAAGEGVTASSRDADDAAVLATCVAIGEHLARTAVDMGDGSVQWLNAIEQHDERVAGALGGPGLYTGSAGTALFLASLARVTDDARWARLARRAAHLRPVDDDFGLADGLAGRAYAAAAVGGLLDDRALVREAATTLLAAIDGDRSGRDVDLMSGHGGLVLAAASVAATADDDRLIGAVGRAAAGLRARFDAQRAINLVEANKANRLGLAHGTGGTTLALARAFAATGDAWLRQWLDELLDAENERIERRGGMPCRVTADAARTPDRTWCWGTAGFAVGRRAIASIVPDAGAEAHVARADRLNAEASPPLHRLCCGTAGTLGALAPSWAAHARHRTSLVGSFGGYVLESGTRYQNASMFRGIAGVGHALLRTLDPTLPDVLTFGPADAR
jgi:type 2 lantibiotic biosynthesis protein LanM